MRPIVSANVVVIHWNAVDRRNDVPERIPAAAAGEPSNGDTNHDLLILHRYFDADARVLPRA